MVVDLVMLLVGLKVEMTVVTLVDWMAAETAAESVEMLAAL